MIKHIVMWRVKDSHAGHSREELVKELQRKLEQLTTVIPEISHLEVGLNTSERPSAFDVVLYSEFADTHSLSTYRDHPEHVKVAEHIKDIVTDGAVVDYNV